MARRRRSCDRSASKSKWLAGGGMSGGSGPPPRWSHGRRSALRRRSVTNRGIHSSREPSEIPVRSRNSHEFRYSSPLLTNPWQGAIMSVA